MDFLNEFGLAVAVAIPVLVIVGMNAFLALSGESGTLLIPGLQRYPEVAFEREAISVTPSNVASTGFDSSRAVAANEAVERQAA